MGNPNDCQNETYVPEWMYCHSNPQDTSKVIQPLRYIFCKPKTQKPRLGLLHVMGNSLYFRIAFITSAM